jgi:putative membrane protein
MTEPKHDEVLAPEEAEGAIYGYGPWPLLTLRCVVGGIMMGIANLVPGISGGTMLLASGIYPRFVQSVAELSRFKFRKQSLFVLGLVALCAAVAIALLANTIKGATVDYRWAMYSLFIGLTLGGVPVVWGLARPADGRVFAGAVPAFVLMAALAGLDTGESASASGFGVMFVAGLVGASAMILPGISGAYLLILLGAYLPVLDAVGALKDALRAGTPMAASDELVGVILPVGLGVVLGVLVVSNLVERLLEKHEKATLGALLGFLLGSVLGLAPFREFYRPAVGDLVGGVRMSAERLAALPAHKWPTRAFEPSALQVAGAVGIAMLGFLLTALLSKFSNRDPSELAIDHPTD